MMRAVVSLSQMASEMERSAPNLANEILRYVWGIPGYSEERISRSELAGILEATVRGVAGSLRHVGDADPATILSAQQIGEARALQGVPVDAMAQSWMTVQRVLVDHLVMRADSLAPDDLRRGVAWLGSIFAVLTRTSVDTYRKTQDEVTAHYDRLTGDLVARLAGAQPADPDDIVQRARILGVDPNAQHLAIAVSASPLDGESAPQAYVRVQRLLLARVAPMTVGRVLIGHLDEFPLLIAPLKVPVEAAQAQIAAAVRQSPHHPQALVGIGQKTARLPQMAAVCRQAREALDVGLRMSWSGRVVRFDTVLPEVLLIRSPDVLEQYVELLRPIMDRPELLDTLRAYVESGLSARETARRVFVHPNTVPYRLKTISSLLGRDVSDPASTVLLELALRAVDLS